MKLIQFVSTRDIMKTIFAFSLFVLFVASTHATGGLTEFIIGGRDAEIGQFPYMVSIRFQAQPESIPRHGCGGGILNKNWVLTVSDLNSAPSGSLLI